MDIQLDNSTKVLKFLTEEIELGKQWVVVEEGRNIQYSSDLKCFKKEFDADQFVHDNTSAFDNMVKFSLENALQYNFQQLINNNAMNTQNLEFLQSNLKYFGFGDQLNEALEKNIKDQKNEFQLKIEIPHFNNKMDYTLHFKKSDSTDMYFFNRYDAALQNGKPELDKIQSFYVNKGNGATAKEAFNLLEGRSVHKDLLNKEGQKYSAWLKIDFDNSDDRGNFKLKQFSEQYGYNLEKTLGNYPIKELGDAEQKTQLLNSLQKGNAQQVTIQKDGADAKYYIEAVPQYKNINVYDQKMHMVKRQSVQKVSESIEKSISPSLKQANKQEQKADADGDKPKQKQAKRRKMSI